MAGFLVKDTLTVLTQNGECHIQLCLGDITRLQHKDKVDVILISAFHGDYSPTPTSVIGALLRNLQISVRNLARDKEEDLRQLYHCWWSKPLPASKPYNRLLCFETKVFGSRRPQELVGDVFRCLVPILNNQDGSVITPLLNTGDQGFGYDVMLKGMVEAAVNWMKAGLPLRMLKIVLYCRGNNDSEMEQAGQRQFKRVFEIFEELKGRYMMKDLIPKEVTINFDVYLSFSKHDTEVVSHITDKLRANKADIRIFDSSQKMDVEAVWQEDMYEVMMHSARVVTVLTPNYLQCTSCIEQYNIAMCCSRKAMRNMLAPFYVEESSLPTYMTQVQYVDCRASVHERLTEACYQLVISLSVTLKPLPQMDPTIQYDIFLSYSHSDSERANHIVETLKRLNPDLRLFFDIQELKTGSTWQRTLYHAIDGTRVMLALVSNKYLSSAVCQEEYNLALAKHCSESPSLKLVPLCIEDLYEVSPEFTKVKMVDGKGGNFTTAVETTCAAVVDWLAGKDVAANVKQLFEEDRDLTINVDTVLESARRLQFQLQHGNKDNLLSKKVNFPVKLPTSLPDRPKDNGSGDNDEASKCDVVLSYAAEDEKYALYIAGVLGRVSGVAVKTKVSSDHERLALMDRARHIVAILSPHYTNSLEKCEEFNIALSRQRMSTGQVLFPVHVHVLPKQPTYFRLVPSRVSATDDIWPELCTNLKIDTLVYTLESQDIVIAKPMELALHEAAFQILQEIKIERTSSAQSSDEVAASPTLLNVMKLQHQVNHTFMNAAADAVRNFLVFLNEEDRQTSIQEVPSESQPDAIKDGLKDNEARNQTSAHQTKPDSTELHSPDSCTEEPAQTGSQPPEGQGRANSKDSHSPDSCTEEPAQTGSQHSEGQGRAGSPAHVPEKISKDNMRPTVQRTESGIVRVDETGRHKKGSTSCVIF